MVHGDPVAPILIALMLIVLGALLGGHLMKRLGQPAVLGELIVGMLVANLAYYFKEPTVTVLREGDVIRTLVREALTHKMSLADAARELLPATPHTFRLIEILSRSTGIVAASVYLFIDLLSRIGVIILLFLVGLESSGRQMRQVGKTSLLVATVGVICPFLLGMGTVALLFPAAPFHTDLFIGALLTATSVAITARVLGDWKQSQRVEAKIILGAAVIDDVLGLLLLAVVTGIVVTGTFNLLNILMMAVKAVLFLAGSIIAGLWVIPRIARHVAHINNRQFELIVGLSFAFVLSWIANWIGLATIVGAFAAGLILGDLFEKELGEGHSLRNLLTPLESLIVPVFFVVMGMQVKLEALADWRAVVIAAGLTAAAIVGKLVTGLVCSRKLNRLLVGVGMLPRGEVGLIFATVGKGLGVMTDATFSAVVLMVMITTLITPPLLTFSLKHGEANGREPAAALEA